MDGPKLTALPDGSEDFGPYLSSLRRGALQCSELPADTSFSDGFLMKFLRARDFDVELSVKVGYTNTKNHSTPLRLQEGTQSTAVGF
uniref:CRAL/TRIO N-terminal domain-containing protein n=1 Tax=Labrus bergylta TaxID=56723 RepID=A0A3Q3E4J1_9LABR